MTLRSYQFIQANVNYFDPVIQEWWTHLWLKEGFASFMEYLIVDHCFPEFDVWTQFVSEDFAHSLKLDALRNRCYFRMSTGLSVTYPSPNPTLTATSHLGENVGLGEGWVGRFQYAGELPTYPSPNPTLTLTSHFGQNVGLGGSNPSFFY